MGYSRADVRTTKQGLLIYGIFVILLLRRKYILTRRTHVS